MGRPVIDVRNNLLAIDCFAGAGGLSLGLSIAGFHVAAAFDADPIAVKTYARNLGDHIRVAKAEDIEGEDLMSQLPPGVEIGLVAGGPPCQGFSRQRRGADIDSRNELVSHFTRIVFSIRPVMFLMENVSSIQGPRGEALLSNLRLAAKQHGYHVQMKVLDAADFGVPQHRRRMFVVGELLETGQHFEFPNSTVDPPHYRTVRDAFEGLPDPRKAGVAELGIPNHQPDRISALNRERISHVPEGGGRADIPYELRLPCHQVSVEVAGHRGVYGRLSWNQPAGTLTTKCNSFTRGRFAHPIDNRNISMREAARIQSFPDDFVFEGSKVDVAHQIGNAVPPLLATELGTAIKMALLAKGQGSQRTSDEDFALTAY